MSAVISFRYFRFYLPQVHQQKSFQVELVYGMLIVPIVILEIGNNYIYFVLDSCLKILRIYFQYKYPHLPADEVNLQIHLEEDNEVIS
eukprot:UN09143